MEHETNGRAGGFTLVELMVVLVILATLAMVAVPVLTKDNRKAEFDNYVRRFSMDVQRAHMEAISAREDRALILYSGKYTVNAVLPGSTTFSKIAERTAPSGVEIYGLSKVAAEPGRSYSVPSGGLSGGEEIRLRATGDVAVNDSAAYEDVSATVFFHTENKVRQARVVIFQSTSFSKLYKGW